ncbi:hypothetical protein E8E11_006010 [Didymella keratinophila]|nr:hypothetical protein E8E11_006010 [Didymella keratinophila]
MDDNAAERSPGHSSDLVPIDDSQPLVMSFLDLPPEIRNIIYKWLFPKGKAAAQLLVKRNGGYLQMSDRFTILETCHQIYQEVSSLLRGQQRFVVKQPKTLTELLDSDDDYADFSVESRIFHYTHPEHHIDFHHDLDHSTVSNKEVALLHVSQGIRQRVAGYNTIRITAALSVTGGFQRLRQWVHSGRNLISDLGDESFAQSNRIELRIPQASCDNNGNFTIDTMELISATYDLDSITSMQTVVYEEQKTTPGDDQELHGIRAGLLLFIHTLIKKSPDGTCPKIWMRRDLRVAFADFEYEDGSIERVANKNATCSWHRIFEYVIAADLVRYYYNMEGLQPHGRALTSVAKTLAITLCETLY